MFPTVVAEELSQVTSLAENSDSTSDANKSHENTRVSTQPNNRQLTLKMLLIELMYCIALPLMTYGVLNIAQTKISKHPQAVRFFNEDSVVADWYRGQLSDALASVNDADVSFVMYYAPWDAESQYVRGEFEKAALVLGDRVNFAAINCWNPGSECRLQHNKIPSWPVLMAYTVISRGVLYKGPKDAHSMVNFMEIIMKPLKRVASTEDLINLLSYCDAVAVGYTPLSETSKYYNTWYHTSLKAREYDTIGEICFASVTSEELAVDLGVEVLPNARLMLWNDTKEYISEGANRAWNESALMIWVLENFSQPVARIIPLWKKAFSFERFVDGNPILIMFTPLNPIYEQLPNYALMREVAMEYYNCKNNDSSQWTAELIKLQRVQRLLYQQKDYIKFCHEFKFKKPIIKPNNYRNEVESHSLYPWNNSIQKTPNNGLWSNFFLKRGVGISRDSENYVEDPHSDFWSLDWLKECGSKTFPAERSFYDIYEQCRLFEQSFNFVQEETELKNGNIETSMLPHEDDPLSPENLIQDNVKHFCKILKFAQEFSPSISPSKVDESHNLTRISGLSCANNFSLYMIAIDSVHNHHFAESLGIDVLSKKDMTAVVILDSKHESQYLLSEQLSAKSLRDFIYNYTNKGLKRSLRTHVGDAAHTHYFGSVEGMPEPGNDTVHIVELTTRSFRKIARTPGMLTIISVCGGVCGALTSLAVCGAARLLRACGVPARAARLDARRHDLPWEYTPHAYPALLVFPPDRDRAESVAFPSGVRVTASGVIALALRSLGAPHHLRVRLVLCTQPQSNAEKKTCLKDIREHITTVIGRNLKYWRRADNRELKDALFKRLQHLHQVSLELSLLQVKDLNENSIKQSSLLNSLSSLAKNWDIDVSLLRKNNTEQHRRS